MATLLLFPVAIIFIVALVLLAIGGFVKFFKRDEAKEQEIENMMAARRNLFEKMYELQNQTNVMQAEIDRQMRRLPHQSKRAFSDKQMLMTRGW